VLVGLSPIVHFLGAQLSVVDFSPGGLPLVALTAPTLPSTAVYFLGA